MVERFSLPTELEALLSADGSGPAARIDAVVAAQVLERVISQREQERVRERRRTRLGWLLVAALVLTGSAAAMYARQRSAVPAQPVPHALPRASKPVPPREPSAAQPPQAPAPQSAPAAPRLPPAALGHASSGVDDLLERANRQRGAGDYRAAERSYLRVVAQSPRGAAAYAARVAVAGMRLERDSDPRGALRLYTQALRTNPKGALSPEIYEGMAHAYRALGRPLDEQRALRSLLRDQPAGPAAERAQQRLQGLDAQR